MKTAEEWICGCLTSSDESLLDGSYIRAIQLDAAIHGMRLAAEILGSDAILQMESHVRGKLAGKKQDILDAANNLREI